MMSKSNAKKWVQQEFQKVLTKEQAEEHLQKFRYARDGFFKSDVGQASALKEPHARKARFDVADQIAARFGLIV